MTMTSDSSAAGAYRLEWKEFQSAFLDKLDSFRQCSTFSDVTLLSSDGSKSFEAHRLILTAGSGYFEEVGMGWGWDFLMASLMIC